MAPTDLKPQAVNARETVSQVPDGIVRATLDQGWVGWLKAVIEHDSEIGAGDLRTLVDLHLTRAPGSPQWTLTLRYVAS